MLCCQRLLNRCFVFYHTPYTPTPWLGALPSYRVFGLFLNTLHVLLHPRSLTRSCASEFIPLLEIANCAAKDHRDPLTSGNLEEQKLKVALEVLSRIAATLFSSAPAMYMRSECSPMLYRPHLRENPVCVVCVCVRVCVCVCVCRRREFVKQFVS